MPSLLIIEHEAMLARNIPSSDRGRGQTQALPVLAV